VVAGRSLVAWVGKIVTEIEWIDKVVLSTDDHEIAQEGRKHGMATPFMRPRELAADGAGSIDMWRHAWIASEEHYGTRFDLSILLEPTSPLRRAEDIARTVDHLVAGKHRSAATVSRTPAHFTPEKCLQIDGSGRIDFYHPEGARVTGRQSIPQYYHRNGICYAATRSSLVDEGNLLEDDCGAVVIERPVVNIDEYLDLEWAAFLFARSTDADIV